MHFSIYMLSMPFRAFLILFVSAGLGSFPARGESWVERDATPLYRDFFNRDFPFFEATLALPEASVPHDVVPRAIILPLENDLFVAFDTELLRVAAIWRGDYPTLRGIAMHSYALPLEKVRGGTGDISRPQGEIWYRSNHLSDWHHLGQPLVVDPRTTWTDPQEPARGPLPFAGWTWSKLDGRGPHARLHYRINGTEVQEDFRAASTPEGLVVRRFVTIAPRLSPLRLQVSPELPPVDIPTGQAAMTLVFAYDAGGVSLRATDATVPGERGIPPPAPRWPDTMTTRFELGESVAGYAEDQLTLPYPNVWERRLRLVDLTFDATGRAHVLTYDGDVYELTGLASEDGRVTWRRVAAGFNEPMALARQNEQLHVLSRGGITRLIDQNGDGEFDTYELFSNRFVQSPDTRDFGFSLVPLPDGGFLVSKGGQQVSSRNPHSGRILQIRPDGQRVSVHATGFRNAFIARDPSTGIITATDQQGNWVPTTPFHIIEPDHFYGYAPSIPADPPPISSPRLWFPHAVSPSAVGMVMGFDDRTPSLRGTCLVLDYKTSRGLVTDLSDPRAPQVSAAPLPVVFNIPILNGAINPADGRAYLVGFQVWDSFAPRLEGLSRLRTNTSVAAPLPKARPFAQGILLQNLRRRPDSSFEVKAWNYRRSEKYGSPQFKNNGEPGMDLLPVLGTSPSIDEQSVFLHLPAWAPSMTVTVTHHHGGTSEEIYLSAHELASFSEARFGFAPIAWDHFATRADDLPGPAAAPEEVSLARGKTLVTQMGCVGCHAASDAETGKSGPSWVGLAGSTRRLVDGTEVLVDRAYLEEAILNPAGKVPEGYDDPDAGMPPYLGVLSEAAVESIILYLESLQ